MIHGWVVAAVQFIDPEPDAVTPNDCAAGFPLPRIALKERLSGATVRLTLEDGVGVAPAPGGVLLDTIPVQDTRKKGTTLSRTIEVSCRNFV